MKPASLLAQPLSEAEIEALDHFLGSDSTPEEAMDVSMMDGFITAIASGPNVMMPSDLLRWIWDPDAGAASPAFASANESQRIIALILRHWNDVNDRLNHAPEQYEPLVMERESNGSMVSVIDEWCVGYFKGIETDRAAWAPLLAEHPDWFTVIFLYGTEDGWKELERRQDTHEQHQAFANSLGESARRIHHYWLAQRKAQIARGEMPGVVSRSEPLRRAPKIGRNDPCPCGSGKKYKRCHGAAENDESFAPENASTERAPTQHATVAAEDAPVHSALSQRVTREGTSVEIEIYDDGAGGWLLEAIDEFGNSTVWNDAFPTEAAALAQAMSTIDTEGIASLVGAPPADTTRH